MIRAIGDAAFVIDAEGARIVDARGVVAQWPEIFGHAAHAQPPRLAILRRDRSIALIDVATGEVQHEYGWRFVPLAFSLDGRKLFVRDIMGEKGVAILSFEGRVFTDESVRTTTRVVLSRSAPFAGTSGNGVIVVGTHATRGVVFVGAHEALAFSRDDARLLTLERTNPGFTFSVFRAHDGARVDGAPSLACRTRPAAVWCSAALDEIAALDVDGTVRRATAGRARPIEFVAQPPRPRSEDPGPGVVVAVDHDVRVDGDRGASLVDPARTLDVCFTPAGACVVVRDGTAFTLDDRGRALAIEGPTNLVAITPHPRGVLALDDDERAHVLDVDELDPTRASSQVRS